MPGRMDHFCGGEFDGLGAVGGIGEDFAVAGYDGHYEEGAGEVAEEGYDPVLEHFEDACSAVQG